MADPIYLPDLSDLPDAVRIFQTARERLDGRFKGRPVASAGGLFMIRTAWRQRVTVARAEGRQPPSWTQFLVAAFGVATPAALIRRLAARAWARARAVLHGASPPGASTRARMVARR